MGITQTTDITLNTDGFTPEEKSKVERLRHACQTWVDHKDRWALYLSAYESGPDFAKRSNLFKHARENDEDYNDRVERVHNMNYCEPLCDFFTNFIYGESIDRHGGANSEFFQDFVKNVDLKGNTIDQFMREDCDDMQIFGMSYVLVDSPSIPEPEQLSKADEIARNLRPYWVLVKAEEIVDWVRDEFDNWLYAKRRQYVQTLGADGSPRTIERYTEFWQDKITVSEIDVTDPQKPTLLPSQTIGNSLGEVPIVISRYKRSKKEPQMGVSFLRDFAYNNREIMNLTSMLQEFLYRQAFNILARESPDTIPLKEEQDTVLGTENVVEYPRGGKAPEYITPPADPAKFIQDERSKVKAEMFLLAAQEFVNDLYNGGKSSGFSQAQSFSRTVPFISARADALEKTENKLMQLTMKLIGKEWDGKIKYKDRYEITNLTDSLTQLLMIVRDLAVGSETFVKEELKRMVREYDGKLPVELLTKIEKEIEEMDFKDWQELQKEALVGPNKASPGDQQKPKGTGTMAEVQSESKTPNTKQTKKLKGK
jgi:hypothetical protein